MNAISHSTQKRAIIDIGSNTVRLVIYTGPLRAPVVEINEKVNARLGRDLGKTGALSDKALKLALGALARFALLLRLHEVEAVECVATAAARDASNGPDFLAAVRALGLSPRLLSGEEEASASATGVIAAFPGAHGTVADLGGGSLELVGVDAGRVLAGGVTLPFGSLRLGDLRAGGDAAFAGHVVAGLRRTGWKAGRGEPLYIVGGSWRALALQAMRTLGWPVDDPHGFELGADEAVRMARELSRGKPRNPDPRISSARIATMPDAAALLAEVVTAIAPSKLVFSSWGLREGLLHAALEEQVQAQDPLLASVAGFAKTARTSIGEAVAVSDWCAAVCRDAAGDKALRQASTLLALAAMHTEPNLRAEEATAWALRKRWIGLDMAGRGMMAMTIFANAGETRVPDDVARLAAPADLDRAIAWGLAIRLCRRLHGGSINALAATHLACDERGIVLGLDEAALPLLTSGTFKDLKALGEWLGRDWLVLGPADVVLEG